MLSTAFQFGSIFWIYLSLSILHVWTKSDHLNILFAVSLKSASNSTGSLTIIMDQNEICHEFLICSIWIVQQKRIPFLKYLTRHTYGKHMSTDANTLHFNLIDYKMHLNNTN